MLNKIINTIIEILLKITSFFETEDIKPKNNPIYKKKRLMTNCEQEFYNKMSSLKADYEIMPQVNLATIINRTDNVKYHNELFRNIDFAIFSKNYEDVLLLIELNDKSHNKYSRKDRDLKVKKICNDANIKLMTFYTNYPNEKDYIINRIKNEIEKKPNQDLIQTNFKLNFNNICISKIIQLFPLININIQIIILLGDEIMKKNKNNKNTTNCKKTAINCKSNSCKDCKSNETNKSFDME